MTQLSELSEFQQAAILSFCPERISVTIFEPTESAIEAGYRRIVLPIEEGRKEWKEYKLLGLEEYFYYHEESFTISHR